MTSRPSRLERKIIRLAVTVLRGAAADSGERKANGLAVQLALNCLLRHCPERWPPEMFWDAARQDKTSGAPRDARPRSTASSASSASRAVMKTIDDGGRDGFSRGAERDHVDRPLRTLKQCALHRRIIRLTCGKCRRVRRLDAIALWWLFQRPGWDDRVVGVARRLRCASCHEGEGAVVRPSLRITRDRADDVQLPFPDASTWKRLVSRYRS